MLEISWSHPCAVVNISSDNVRVHFWGCCFIRGGVMWIGRILVDLCTMCIVFSGWKHKRSPHVLNFEAPVTMVTILTPSRPGVHGVGLSCQLQWNVRNIYVHDIFIFKWSYNFWIMTPSVSVSLLDDWPSTVRSMVMLYNHGNLTTGSTEVTTGTMEI